MGLIQTITQGIKKLKDMGRARLLVCAKCPLMQLHKGAGMVCGDIGIPTDKTCGCILKLKAYFPGEDCPSNKWTNDSSKN